MLITEPALHASRSLHPSPPPQKTVTYFAITVLIHEFPAHSQIPHSHRLGPGSSTAIMSTLGPSNLFHLLIMSVGVCGCGMVE